MGFGKKETMRSLELGQLQGPDLIAVLYIICYFLVNLSFLSDFPFVHSDESWLSGLSRNMAEKGSIGVTESFFDLKPRFPHAIKTLFHLMQMGMMRIFGYEIATFRLLSLIFGCLSLFLFYRTLKAAIEGAQRSILPLLGCILLSVDIQFLYAAHFARQEILLVFMLILCLNFILQKRPAAAGVAAGLCIGIHPNSFLLAAMCGLMLLPLDLSALRSREGRRPLLQYATVVSGFAALFVAVSLYLDREFVRHYAAYGSSEFEIGAPVTHKLAEFPYFLKKIWLQVSGTYYVPDIRVELILFALILAVSIAILIWFKPWAGTPVEAGSETASAAWTGTSFSALAGTTAQFKLLALIRLLLKGILGMAVGMVVIGRYNQTSIVFFFPLFFMLLIAELKLIFTSSRLFRGKGMRQSVLPILLILLIGCSSILQIRPWLTPSHSYETYLEEISKAVLPDHNVLANLNSEYYFENGMLLDYRNLAYLKENQLSVADYIREKQIEYIILSNEMDLIYAQRPVWNIIYGNPRYMEELREFTKEKCTLVHSFQNNIYGVRIIPYMDRSDHSFTVEIFKVEDPAREP